MEPISELASDHMIFYYTNFDISQTLRDSRWISSDRYIQNPTILDKFHVSQFMKVEILRHVDGLNVPKYVLVLEIRREFRDSTSLGWF